MLIKEISDPRLHDVYLTDVRVDRELAYADVYVSAVEGKSRAAEIVQGMESAGGYLRRNLTTRVELRAFPRLRFHWDPTPEHAEHIERLLDQIRQETPSTEKKK